MTSVCFDSVFYLFEKKPLMLPFDNMYQFPLQRKYFRFKSHFNLNIYFLCLKPKLRRYRTFQGLIIENLLLKVLITNPLYSFRIKCFQRLHLPFRQTMTFTHTLSITPLSPLTMPWGVERGPLSILKSLCKTSIRLKHWQPSPVNKWLWRLNCVKRECSPIFLFIILVLYFIVSQKYASFYIDGLSWMWTWYFQWYYFQYI